MKHASSAAITESSGDTNYCQQGTPVITQDGRRTTEMQADRAGEFAKVFRRLR